VYEMKPMLQNQYNVSLADDLASLAGAFELRAAQFGNGAGDRDDFDALCNHVLIRDMCTDELVCTFRFLHLNSGRDIHKSYSAQFYDLENLRGYSKPLMEIGRFCIDPVTTDPNVLRAAWAFITQYVDDSGVGLLFGCSSFQGTEIAPYQEAFALLKLRYLAPKKWQPAVKAAHTVNYANEIQRKPDLRRATQELPSLLRTYLTMGGWVSDHAVVDSDLNTLHVFTGVEIDTIPESRERLLRASVA